MRFDDTLETVLAADLSTPFGRQSAWRQLVDLIGRRRVPADSRAIGVLKAIRADVKPQIRAATARMLEFADPPEALARLFILDEIAIAMPVVRTARLSSDEWLALLPLMAPQVRSILRNRRDIGPRVVRGLEAYGAIDLVLGDERPVAQPEPEPVPALADAELESDCPEMGPPRVDGDDTGADKDATVPDMSLIEQYDASMTPQDDTAQSAPSQIGRHTGSPRFVQFGAVALGIPVVAQAVRMASDPVADGPAPIPADAPLADPGAADLTDALLEDALAPGEGAGSAGAVAPVIDGHDPAGLTDDAAGLAEGGVVAATDDAPIADTDTGLELADPLNIAADDVALEVADMAAPALAPVPTVEGVDDAGAALMLAPSPILPIPDALRLAEGFPVDSANEQMDAAVLGQDGDVAGASGLGDAPLADAPDDKADATDRGDAPAPLTAEGQPLSDDAAVAEVPAPLLETGMGAAAMGGLAILSAVSSWSRALAGHLDVDAVSPGVVDEVDPVAVDAVAVDAVADAPDADEAASDLSVPDVSGQVAPDDADIAPPRADAPDAEAMAVADEVDGESFPAMSPLALAGIGAGALAAPLLVAGQGDDAANGQGEDKPAASHDDMVPPVADDIADVPVADEAVAVDQADEPALADAPAPDEAVVADIADTSGAVTPIRTLTDRVPDRAGDGAGHTFRIADVVARIDAYQKRQADEAVAPPPPVPGDGFRFEADARGVIRWVEGVSRGALIGRALDQSAPAGGHGFDASVAGAFRHRASFSNARLGIAGESDASGDWLVSAVPSFDQKTGRFSGYRGAARRPRLDERAELPAVKRPNPIESLRELIHELRTPAGAITGFAELIETQMLGPVPEAYRDQALAIRTQARELLAVIDDLDLAARIEARALELRPGSVPLKRLVDGIVAQLAQLAQERQVVLERAWGDDVVKGDERAVDRLIARLLATLVGAGSAGETLNVRIGRDSGEMVRIEMTRPRALDTEAPTEPGEDDPSALGTGFALRLAVNLAQELGGSLMFGADRLTLRLPGADDPQVDQAVHH